MLRIAVCDDDETICTSLERYITNACKSNYIESEIDLFSSGKTIKNHLRNGSSYNILFLDIELADDTGISVSECIRNEIKDEATQIIYVSGKNEYDRQLFAFRPFSFIEKPFDQEIIKYNIDKYIRIYGDKIKNELFHYKYGHDTFWININSILYFKSNRKIINIVTLNNTETFYGTISSIIEQIDSRGFFSPHKSYYVNYRYVKAFQSDLIIMVNGDRIPIAKGKRNVISQLQLHFENGGH